LVGVAFPLTTNSLKDAINFATNAYFTILRLSNIRNR